MTPGLARTSERPALRRLWMRCFGDSIDYVNLYFDHSFREDSVFVLRDADGTPVSMAIRFPADWLAEDGDPQTGAYLYAVCTDPAQRGRGCFRTLMDFAERTLAAAGCDFVCLKPADAALAETYRRRGYEDAFFTQTQTVRADGAAAVTLRRIDAARYAALRQLQLRGSFVDYPPQTLAHQAQLGPLWELSEGDRFAICAAERYDAPSEERAAFPGCPAAPAQTADRTAVWLVKEYLGDETLLPGLCAALGADRIAVRRPPTPAAPGTPFAMAKPLSGKPRPSGYLGLAFD